jgi:hypothetical protein
MLVAFWGLLATGGICGRASCPPRKHHRWHPFGCPRRILRQQKGRHRAGRKRKEAEDLPAIGQAAVLAGTEMGKHPLCLRRLLLCRVLARPDSQPHPGSLKWLSPSRSGNVLVLL